MFLLFREYNTGGITMQQAPSQKIIRNQDTNTTGLSIEVPENIKEGFRKAVEKNGKNIEEVLTLYMKKYIWKQGELQRNRQKRREGIGGRVC